MNFRKFKIFLKWSLLGLALFCFFLFLTFPYSRLAPKARGFLEGGLSRGLGITTRCNLEDFDLALPLGVKWSLLSCQDASDQTYLEVEDGRLSVLPFFQSLSGRIGKGEFRVRGSFGLGRPPSEISGTFKNLPMQKMAPLLGILLSRINPMVPRTLKLEGNLNGSFDMPLENLKSGKGGIDIRFDQLKAPEQSLLSLIGLRELAFTKSQVKAELSSGRLQLQDLAFLSKDLSGKIEGSLDFGSGKLSEALPNLTFKWQVTKSDAMMSAPLGQAVASAPCPSPDAQGFCSRRVNRMSELLP